MLPPHHLFQKFPVSSKNRALVYEDGQLIYAVAWGPPASASPSASGAPSPTPLSPMSGDSQLPATSAPTKATPKAACQYMLVIPSFLAAYTHPMVSSILGGKPVSLQQFNNRGNKNKGKSGWSKSGQPPAPAGGISPLAEPKPSGPVNACG